MIHHILRLRRRTGTHRQQAVGQVPAYRLLTDWGPNWFSQMISVTLFNLRTIPERRGAVAAAAVGIAGVVAVFVGFLSIAAGFRAAMAVPGSGDIAIVLRSGADTEMTSGLSREETRLIADAPGIARDTN